MENGVPKGKVETLRSWAVQRNRRARRFLRLL